jgi:TetR/AcrR family transcriptional regulator, repressor for neighboring sulfatase
MPTKKKPPPPPRRRRAPETARAEILDAAERVLAASPPDAVGLKEVAEAAGVSHGLVSHYFGTYDELVDEVLVRRHRRIRENALARFAEPSALLLDQDALLDALFRALDDPLYVRLSLWSLASGRASGEASILFREQGMRIFAEAAVAHVARLRPDLDPQALRARMELALVIVNSAAYGFTVAKEAWMGALGRAPSRAFDEDLRRALGSMVRRFLLDGG